MVNQTYSNRNTASTMFTLFPRLPAEIRLKIFRLALSTPCIIPLSVPRRHLVPIASPHPLLHTNHEARTCALEKHTLYPSPAPGIPPILINTSLDYPFFTDIKTFDVVSFLKVNGNENMAGLPANLRHFALPLKVWEALLRGRGEEALFQILRNFPSLEIVLVVGDVSEVLKCGDLEFVEAKQVPRTGMLVELAMEVFQPWRAFEGLVDVEVLESAVGRWVEGVNKSVRGDSGSGMDEWKVPKFRIRRIRSGCETNA
jgi:hypothetical protein